MLSKRVSGNIRDARVAVVVTLLLLTVAATGSAQAQTYKVLHAFTNTPDGGNPNPIIRDTQGNLYGTTIWGGVVCGGGGYTCGTVFKVDKTGHETVLYRFAGGEDGANPVAVLIRDTAGNLYGTTRGNGSIPAVSTLFKVDPHGHETVLYHFNGFSACCEDSPLVLDAAGNLYGNSPYGGEFNCGVLGLRCGTVYKVTQAGKFTVLHNFAGKDGTQPEGGLVRDAAGNLYGSTYFGGDLNCHSPAGGQNPPGCGVIFRLSKSGKFTVFHRFTGHADGSTPLGLIQDPDGNLYGLSGSGGDLACNVPVGCGTIFRVDAGGKFAVLFTFTAKNIPQPDFASHLLRDLEGNLYGAAQIGGTNFSGFLFKLDPTGKFSNLFSFPSTAQFQDGSLPGGVVKDLAGNFYGSMAIDGQPDCGPPGSGEGCGTVFKITF
jgi:uncharacterized repeat protein (TIGR03803 family)